MDGRRWTRAVPCDCAWRITTRPPSYCGMHSAASDVGSRATNSTARRMQTCRAPPRPTLTHGSDVQPTTAARKKRFCLSEKADTHVNHDETAENAFAVAEFPAPRSAGGTMWLLLRRRARQARCHAADGGAAIIFLKSLLFRLARLCLVPRRGPSALSRARATCTTAACAARRSA
jgi:hypothetical protein